MRAGKLSPPAADPPEEASYIPRWQLLLAALAVGKVTYDLLAGATADAGRRGYVDGAAATLAELFPDEPVEPPIPDQPHGR